MTNYLLQQFLRTRKMIGTHVEGLTEEASSIVPNELNNNIKWQLGHIVLTADFFVLKETPTVPKEYENYFAPGTKPADWNGAEPRLAEILNYLNEQSPKIQQFDISKYNITLPKRFKGSETVGDLIALAAFHEAYHVGQINIIRKLINE